MLIPKVWRTRNTVAQYLSHHVGKARLIIIIHKPFHIYHGDVMEEQKSSVNVPGFH